MGARKSRMGEQRLTGADRHWRAGRENRWTPEIEFTVGG